MEQLMSIEKPSLMEELVLADVDVSLEVCRELKNGMRKIRESLDAIYEKPLETQVNIYFRDVRSALNKYSLFQSDCRWIEYDDDLKEIVGMIDQLYNDFWTPAMCYVAHRNETFSMRFVLRVANELEEICKLLERKINELESVIYASYAPILNKVV